MKLISKSIATCVVGAALLVTMPSAANAAVKSGGLNCADGYRVTAFSKGNGYHSLTMSGAKAESAGAANKTTTIEIYGVSKNGSWYASGAHLIDAAGWCRRA